MWCCGGSMSSENDLSRVCWFLLVILIVLTLTWVKTDNIPREGYFYVESGNGYFVSMSDEFGHRTRVSKDWLTVQQATRLADSLNKALASDPLLGNQANVPTYR